MLMLLIVVGALVAGLLRGGSMLRLAAVPLRAWWLAGAGLALQFLIFTPFRETPLIVSATTQLYLLSMAILVVWVALNRHLAGVGLMAAGLLLNFAAIAANGGYMPVDPALARIAGNSANYEASDRAISNNSIATTEGVRLWLLTDILPIPAWFPFANVYSIGDVLLTLGGALFAYRTVKGPRPAPGTL